jgi:hypothetical protein
MKNFKFLLLLFLTVSSYGQTKGYNKMRGSQLILKNGDTLNVKGKLKSKGFKYKRHNTSKPLVVNYSEIESIKIRFNKDNIAVFKPFIVKGKNKLIPVQELVVGDKASLYGVTNSLMRSGAGGIRFQQTSTVYYFKRAHHKELIKLGSYQPIFGDLKDKIKIVFKDCDLLLEKIKKKEFRMRNGLEPMFVFYNTKCQ